MRKNILIIGIIAVAAYIIGSESARSRGKNYEDLRHQLERLWNEPRARKSRRELSRRAGRTAKHVARNLGLTAH